MTKRSQYVTNRFDTVAGLTLIDNDRLLAFVSCVGMRLSIVGLAQEPTSPINRELIVDVDRNLSTHWKCFTTGSPPSVPHNCYSFGLPWSGDIFCLLQINAFHTNIYDASASPLSRNICLYHTYMKELSKHFREYVLTKASRGSFQKALQMVSLTIVERLQNR